MKYKIIALFGKAGVGKDYIKKLTVDNYFIYNIISSTTRPPREYELDGVDYHFLSNDTFAQQVIDGTMLEATVFRDWCYGTSLNDISNQGVNLGIFNISGIECLLQDSRLAVQPVYIEASDKTRLIRQLQREENPDCQEICRRFSTDTNDFLDISFSYITINNDHTPFPRIYDTLYHIAKDLDKHY